MKRWPAKPNVQDVKFGNHLEEGHDKEDAQAAGSAEAVAPRRAEATELQQLRRDNKRL